MDYNKGYLLVLATAIISGFSIFINQFGVRVVNPYIFTGLKNITAALLLFGFILFLREWKQLKNLKRKDWLTLILIGFVGGSIPFLLFFKGLSLVTSAEASFIHKTMFLYVAIFSFFILKEKINKNLILGILLLLAGNTLLLRILPNISLGRGALLVFIATLFWAGEQIISKKAVLKISPPIMAWGRMFFGFLLILIFWLLTGELQLMTNLNSGQISWVFLTAIILFGYLVTWYTGIRYIPISQATCILALGAPVTCLLELIQGKVLEIEQIIGILLIVLGIMVVIRLSRIINKLRRIKLGLTHFPSLPRRG